MLKESLRNWLARFGFEIRRVDRIQAQFVAMAKDKELYRPLFSPWHEKGQFRRYYDVAAERSIVTLESCYVLFTMLRQSEAVPGHVWECGVYRGGTAAMLAAYLKDHCPDKKIILFDTFEGMPPTDAEKDFHKCGDFSDTDVDSVRSFVGAGDRCIIKKGFIPDTFEGLEQATISFAHIDLDIYRSILDSLEFIWPRLSLGGCIVFDDYGFPSCPGARQAVDDFFLQQKAVPLCLHTGQALAFKSAL